MNLPYVWRTGRRDGTYIDLATHLLAQRTIFISSEITSGVASLVIMQLMALAQEKGSIALYLSCPGGSVVAGLAIVDIIDAINCSDVQIHTYCIGECVGIATAILVSGWKGERRAFPFARISLYQDFKDAQSNYPLDLNERERIKKVLSEIFLKRTNPDELPLERLNDCFSEISFFDGCDAIKFGIIDEICSVYFHT